MSKSSSRANGQLSLGPLPVNKLENGSADFKKVENGEFSSALRAAGALIESAREKSGLSRKEVCALMFIGEAQYSRWVSGAPNDTAPMWRLLLLPPEFWIELLPLINEVKGLRRLAMARFLGAAADLALAVDR